MRDTIKDERWFRSIIDRDVARIEKFKNDLKNGSIAPERVSAINGHVYHIKLDVWLAKYSAGEPVSELVAPYRELTNDFLDHFVSEWYNDSLWLLSLGVLLDIDDTTFNALASTIQKNCREDWLYNYLIHYRIPSVSYESSPLLWGKPYPYLDLQQVVLKSEDKVADMRKYLEKSWYKGNKEAGWYDSHKSKFDVYYGYWSFESGAVAKILGLDDSTLKDVPYYPYDLVHFKD